MQAAQSLPVGDGPAPAARQIARAVSSSVLEKGAASQRALRRAEAIRGLQAICQTYDPPVGTQASGALAGVPILLKDLSLPLAGRTCPNGSDFPAPTATCTATLAGRYLAEGGRIIGRSHAPELGGTSSCESRHHGLATRNPYAPELSSGGSSGGAAVAVATGVVPLAHASDAGGSITIPAALCGVVGLKPTHGLIPLGPERIEGAAGFAAHHAFSRDIEDCALALSVGAAEPSLADVAPLQGSIRIGLVETAADGGPTDAAILSRINLITDRLRGLGHEVVPVTLPPVTGALARAERHLRLASLAATVEGLEAQAGQPATSQHFEPATWARLQAGREVTGAQVLNARQEVLRYRAAMEALFGQVDVLLSPALNAAAPPLHALSLMRPDSETQPLNRHYTCFTRPWNLSGFPSLCLPLLRDAQNRPEGALFGAAAGQEALLLSLGLQLQSGIGWRHDHLTTEYPEGAFQ